IWKRRFNHLSHFDWHLRHQVEKDFFTVHDALPLAGRPGPLVFKSDPAVSPPVGIGAGDLVIHPATRWQRKRWPSEHWVHVCRELRPRFQRIVVSCGPDQAEREAAAEIALQAGP